MSLSPQDLQQLKDAFNAWAANDPHPRKPVIQTLSGKSYTSRQLAEGLEKNNEAGQLIVKMVESYIAHGDGTLEDVIADFMATPEKPEKASPVAQIKNVVKNILRR